MKPIIMFGFVVFFLVVSGFHGVMWLLGGIASSYKEWIDAKEDKKKYFREFMGRLFLLILVAFGIYEVFFLQVPNVFTN